MIQNTYDSCFTFQLILNFLLTLASLSLYLQFFGSNSRGVVGCWRILKECPWSLQYYEIPWCLEENLGYKTSFENVRVMFDVVPLNEYPFAGSAVMSKHPCP
jgi:hypothetical protein